MSNLPDGEYCIHADDLAAHLKDKQAAVNAEKGLPGPASPDLCKKLGIDPSDLGSFLTAGGTKTLRTPVPHLVTNKAELEAQHQQALDAVTDEMVRTKEAVLTVLATYISNRDARWWARSEAERDAEIRFVAGSLVHTYQRLETPCPTK